MNKTWTVVAALLLSCVLASAQTSPATPTPPAQTTSAGQTASSAQAASSAPKRPSWEFFVGYQYTYSDYGPMQDLGNAIANSYGETVSYDHNVTMTGGNLTAQKNIGKRWAAAIDIGAFSGTKNADLSRYFQLLGYIPNNITQESTFKASLYTIMVGPQINLWSYHDAHFFVRGMGGALHNSLSTDDTTRKALDFLSPQYKTSATDVAVMGGVGMQYAVYHNIFVRASGDYIHPFSTSTQNYFRISAGIGIVRFKLF